MPTAIAVAPGAAVLSPKVGGAVLVSVISDAHILTTPVTPPASPVAAVGSAVVGTSTVG